MLLHTEAAYELQTVLWTAAGRATGKQGQLAVGLCLNARGRHESHKQGRDDSTCALWQVACTIDRILRAQCHKLCLCVCVFSGMRECEES